MNKGDTIGIIALSGDCDREKVLKSKEYFEKLGYSVKLSKNIYDKNRYLAGSDEDKVSELHKFYSDKDIKLILAARGGFGAIRLINKIDYDLIKSNPKALCGFSDVTALLLMIYKKTGIINYHSPMACSDFAENISNYTSEKFFDALENIYPEYEGNKIYNKGYSKGILWGGNLSTIVSLLGQDFIPNKDFIFFCEDINEPVYKIDKMFSQLFNVSKFAKNCKGIILGEFLESDSDKWLEELFYELARNKNIPIVSGYKITHGKEKITLPVGSFAQINGTKLLINT